MDVEILFTHNLKICGLDGDFMIEGQMFTNV